MEIVFFQRKGGGGSVSIQESFKPLIEGLSKSNNVTLYNVPYEGSNPIKMFKNIRFIHNNSTKKGINHITGDINYGILGLFNRISVLTIHDDYPIRTARHGIIDKIYKWFFWIFLPILLSDVTLCISPATLRNIRKYCPSNKLRLMTHHVVPSIINPKRKPFSKNCPQILQVGTSYQKNLETTLEVLRGLKCNLMVIQKMSEEQKKKADEIGINYSNRYHLPFEEVVKEYDQADVVVFPSLFEGLGVPIYEGQAAGKPVITTDMEPMNWVAGNGAALLRDPLDVEEYRKVLLRIINDDDYRNNLVEKGIQNAKRFSLNQAVEKYMALYNSLLETNLK